MNSIFHRDSQPKTSRLILLVQFFIDLNRKIKLIRFYVTCGNFFPAVRVHSLLTITMCFCKILSFFGRHVWKVPLVVIQPISDDIKSLCRCRQERTVPNGWNSIMLWIWFQNVRNFFLCVSFLLVEPNKSWTTCSKLGVSPEKHKTIYRSFLTRSQNGKLFMFNLDYFCERCRFDYDWCVDFARLKLRSNKILSIFFQRS